MKTIKVAEATNRQLDWLVTKCEGATAIHSNGEFWIVSDPVNGREYLSNLDYTGDWSMMGPIIEREGIQINYMRYDRPPYWTAHAEDATNRMRVGAWAPTPLIAAARCYVASKLGETVEVPKELT